MAVSRANISAKSVQVVVSDKQTMTLALLQNLSKNSCNNLACTVGFQLSPHMGKLESSN